MHMDHADANAVEIKQGGQIALGLLSFVLAAVAVVTAVCYAFVAGEMIPSGIAAATAIVFVWAGMQMFKRAKNLEPAT